MPGYRHRFCHLNSLLRGHLAAFPDLSVHFLLGLPDQILQAHYPAVPGLKRLSVAAVHGAVAHLIPEMVDYMKEGGYAYISEGALVVDVKEESDTREVPPCMILKSDGAALYRR